MPFLLVSLQTKSPILPVFGLDGIVGFDVGGGHCPGQTFGGFGGFDGGFITVFGFVVSFTTQASVSSLPPFFVLLKVPAKTYSDAAVWMTDAARSPGFLPPIVRSPSTAPSPSSFTIQASLSSGDSPVLPAKRYPPSRVAMIDSADSFSSAFP